jgi:hypothetical protein
MGTLMRGSKICEALGLSSTDELLLQAVDIHADFKFVKVIVTYLMQDTEKSVLKELLKTSKLVEEV